MHGVEAQTLGAQNTYLAISTQTLEALGTVASSYDTEQRWKDSHPASFDTTSLDQSWVPKTTVRTGLPCVGGSSGVQVLGD